MPRINVDKDLQVLQHKSKGNAYKSKLVNRLIDMLHRAKKSFGKRDCCYIILDVVFGEKNPGIQYTEDRRHIIIRLSTLAATNIRWAYWNMAHETVHLLAPTGCNNPTNLEEGVACYFANYYLEEILKQPSFPLGPNDTSYKCALKAVKPLFDKDKYFVRKLRNQQPSFQDITKADIIKEFPELTSDELDFLVSKFDRNSS